MTPHPMQTIITLIKVAEHMHGKQANHVKPGQWIMVDVGYMVASLQGQKNHINELHTDYELKKQ